MEQILYYIKKYMKDVLIFLLLSVCIGIMIYSTFIKEERIIEKSNDIAFSDLTLNNEEKKEDVTSKYYVDVKGAVKQPGVYEVDKNTIINDVIKLAGGFQSNAYQNSINMSKKVVDEMVIYVYTKNEIEKYQNENKSLVLAQDANCKTPDYNIYECITEKQSVIEVGESNIKDNNSDIVSSEVKIVNINTASIQELTSLTGVGESKAQAIINYREENGKFSKIEDIMNVSGIGEKAFEKIKDFITV